MRADYLEWQVDELRQAMKEDKSVEAAMLNTLYLDLVRGIREQRKASATERRLKKPQKTMPVSQSVLSRECAYTCHTHAIHMPYTCHTHATSTRCATPSA